MTTNHTDHHDQAAADAELARRFTTLAPALEDRSHAVVPDDVTHFIGGAFVTGHGKRIVVENPATGETLSSIAAASTEQVDAAFTAAAEAFPRWSALSGVERAKFGFRLSRRLAEQSRALAVTETLDGGKPIAESRDADIPLACQHLFHHAGWADKLAFVSPGRPPRPQGVCAQIIPWNFPLLMAAWKVAPALAAGNTVVLKPAETTPLTAHMLASAAADIGLPPGVLNVVFGAGETGAAVGLHPGANKVAFTGSTAVGRYLARNLAGTGRRLTLELGGKGANIVFPDADIQAAVEGIVAGIFFNQGHVCCAGSRLLVHESVHAEVMARLADRVARIRVGDPMDKNTDIGAINSAAQHARITSLVDAAVADGARLLDVTCPVPDPTRFIAPTVLDGVDAAMAIARTEVFGPVLSVMTFRTPAEAVELANDTPYGLAAGVWTTSPERAGWVSSRLRAGVVWVNTYNRFDPTAAFGGFAESGFGREGGRAGMEAYCA